MHRWWVWIGIAVAAAFAYNLDAITGRLKFNQICKTDGGSRFNLPVDKDAAWEVTDDDTYAYQWPFMFDHIAFVRYQNKQGNRSDVKSNGYEGPGQRKYVFSPVDEDQAIRYRFQYKHARFEDDERFAKTQYEVIDLQNGKVAASHTTFSYQWTKPERVLLSAPTGVACWNQQEDIDKFFKSLYTGLRTHDQK